jgi:hypothetical protein
MSALDAQGEGGTLDGIAQCHERRPTEIELIALQRQRVGANGAGS